MKSNVSHDTKAKNEASLRHVGDPDLEYYIAENSDYIARIREEWQP